MNLSKLKRHPHRRLHRLVNALYHDPETVVVRKDTVEYVVANGAKFYLTDGVQDIHPAQPDWLRNVRPTDICLDLGAGIGSVAIPLGMKAAKVFAVEPLFQSELAANTLLNDLPAFIAFEDYQGLALGPPSGETFVSFGGREAMVDTVSFEELRDAISEPIDWLKVDVEGAEWGHLTPQDCEGIREVRIEFHVRRGRVRDVFGNWMRRQTDDEVMLRLWREWFQYNHYDLIEERGIPLPWGQPFAYCYSMNASKVE